MNTSLLSQIGGLKRKKKKKISALKTIFIVVGKGLKLKVDVSKDTMVAEVIEIIKAEGHEVECLVYQGNILVAQEVKTLGDLKIRNKQNLTVKVKEVAEDVDYWVQCGLNEEREKELGEFTFKSQFIPITASEATAMINCYKLYDAGKRLDTDPVPEELKALQKKIDECIQCNFPKCGAFVKLETRSPKDSAIAYRAAKAELKDVIEKSLKDNCPLDLNDRLYAMSNAMKNSLVSRSGKDAMLHHLCSERVFEDLSTALDNVKHGQRDVVIKLVVREYIQLSVESEFRGFVWNSQLNGIGQYHHNIYIESLKHDVIAIKKDCQAFFEQIHPIISKPLMLNGKELTNYVIDIAWIKSTGRVLLVEVNPFDGYYGTMLGSTGLFNWTKDRKVLTQGPLEVRIRNKIASTETQKRRIKSDWWEALMYYYNFERK